MNVVNRVRVFDIGGAEKDLDWLAANYDGCHPEFVSDHLDLSRWPKYFRLVAVYCTAGVVSTKIEARDLTGAPMTGIWGAFSWPSLALPDGGLDDLTGSLAPYIWTARGKTNRTNAEGVAGFGIGTKFGPLYQSWIVSPSTPSDCLVAAGMKGGTDHHGPLHAVFQLNPIVPADPVPPAVENTQFAQALALALATRQVGVSPDGTVIYLSAEQVASEAVDIANALQTAMGQR